MVAAVERRVEAEQQELTELKLRALELQQALTVATRQKTKMKAVVSRQLVSWLLVARRRYQHASMCGMIIRLNECCLCTAKSQQHAKGELAAGMLKWSGGKLSCCSWTRRYLNSDLFWLSTKHTIHFLMRAGEQADELLRDATALSTREQAVSAFENQL